jgi:hypothetical protein
MVNQKIKLDLYYALRDYPDSLRRIKYCDREHNQTYVYLTNNFVLSAFTIAQLYRA